MAERDNGNSKDPIKLDPAAEKLLANQFGSLIFTDENGEDKQRMLLGEPSDEELAEAAELEDQFDLDADLIALQNLLKSEHRRDVS